MYFRWRSLAEGQSLPTKLVLARAGKSGCKAVIRLFKTEPTFGPAGRKKTANGYSIPNTLAHSLINSGDSSKEHVTCGAGRKDCGKLQSVIGQKHEDFRTFVSLSNAFASSPGNSIT